MVQFVHSVTPLTLRHTTHTPSQHSQSVTTLIIRHNDQQTLTLAEFILGNRNSGFLSKIYTRLL